MTTLTTTRGAAVLQTLTMTAAALGAAALLAGCAASAGGTSAATTKNLAATVSAVPDLLAVPEGTRDGQEVCQAPQRHIAVVAMRSRSDIALAKQLAPKVIEQVQEIALRSCGTLSLAIADRQAEATTLQLIGFTPPKRKAFN